MPSARGARRSRPRVPSVPWSRPAASSRLRPLTEPPPIAVIWSPDFRPASQAGPPRITPTSRRPSVVLLQLDAQADEVAVDHRVEVVELVGRQVAGVVVERVAGAVGEFQDHGGVARGRARCGPGRRRRAPRRGRRRGRARPGRRGGRGGRRGATATWLGATSLGVGRRGRPGRGARPPGCPGRGGAAAPGGRRRRSGSRSARSARRKARGPLAGEPEQDVAEALVLVAADELEVDLAEVLALAELGAAGPELVGLVVDLGRGGPLLLALGRQRLLERRVGVAGDDLRGVGPASARRARSRRRRRGGGGARSGGAKNQASRRVAVSRIAVDPLGRGASASDPAGGGLGTRDPAPRTPRIGAGDRGAVRPATDPRRSCGVRIAGTALGHSPTRRRATACRPHSAPWVLFQKGCSISERPRRSTTRPARSPRAATRHIDRTFGRGRPGSPASLGPTLSYAKPGRVQPARRLRAFASASGVWASGVRSIQVATPAPTRPRLRHTAVR